MRRLLPILIVPFLVAGCRPAVQGGSAGRIRVVAAESFWGSIAAQVGGNRVSVQSIVSNPAADPHDYEPTAADGRAFATAEVAIVNGAGYDAWASRLLDASPLAGRAVVNVGKLVGVRAGGNPHLWYSPAYVHRAIARLASAFAEADRMHAGYFTTHARHYEQAGLRRYSELIADIRARFRGVPVGASESIFAPLARALGLRLLTPNGLLDAVSEGTDPTAAAKRTADGQIAARAIRVWVFNSQNQSPDVRRLNDSARRAGVPVVAFTETPAPADASFQSWQVAQLERLRAALARVRRR